MIVNGFEQEKMDHYLKKFHLEKLKPPAEALGLRWTNEQIFVTSEGKRKRKIYFNTPLDDEQVKNIQKARQLLTKEHLAEKFADAIILKHIYGAKLNISKAVQRLKKTYEWLTDPAISKFTYETIEDLSKGFIYTFGHSLTYKPIIIVRPDLMDFSSLRVYNSIYLIFHIVQRYRMIPYHVEKLQLIIDLNHMKVSQIPYSRMYEMLSQISLVFCENSEKTFVLNATGLGSIWGIVKRFMNDEARNRVVFPKQMSELNQFISIDQRQIKYGGTCPNLTEWWPPVATYKQGPALTLGAKESVEPIVQSAPQDISFYSVVDNPSYFGIVEAEQPASKCDCKCVLF